MLIDNNLTLVDNYTRTRGLILLCLSDGLELTQTELTHRIKISHSYCAKEIHRLINLGLISIRYSGRCSYVCLTRSGVVCGEHLRVCLSMFGGVL